MNHLKSAILLLGVLLPAVRAASAQQTGRQAVDTTVALERGGTLSISLFTGRVSVTGSSGSNVHVRGQTGGGEMRVRSRSSTVSINMEPGWGRGGNADLQVTVPTGTRVVLEGQSASFSVRGVRGEASVESQSGSIVVFDAIGKVNAESVSGSIRLERIRGDVNAESVSGMVELLDIQGDVDVETVSSAVRMRRVTAGLVRSESVGGSISFDGSFEPAGNYSFTTHAGQLTLAVPREAGATVRLETFSGSVDSDFPVTLEPGTARRGHESRFEFRIGNGRSRVTIETFSGDIRILRGPISDNRE